MFRALAVILLFAAAAFTQEAMPPGLEIVKFAWQDDSRDIVVSVESQRIGRGRYIPPPQKLVRRESYEYSLTLRNTGNKQIKAVSWEHLFLNPGDGALQATHRFGRFKKISPNKQATLSINIRRPPSKIVSAAGLDKDREKPFDEKLNVLCVVYADGTEWRNANSKTDGCGPLRFVEQSKKKK